MAEFVSLASFYGFEELKTGVLEDPHFFTPLTKGGLMAERQSILARTRSGKEVFLRPSLTLSLVRSYLTQKMNDLPHPLKFHSEGESFSLSPNKGEAITVSPEFVLLMIGEEGPVAEAEILHVLWKGLLKSGFDIEKLSVRINAAGCASCRSSFRSSFLSHFRSKTPRFCRNCKKHLRRAPTKILVCEDEKCRMVVSHHPQILDFLCEACKKHLRVFLEFLDEIPIPYFLDPRFFKENSPYSVLIFEIALCDNLSQEGGENKSPHLPAGPHVKSFDAEAGYSERWGDKERRLVLSEGGRLSGATELMAGKKLDVAGGVLFMHTLGALFKEGNADGQKGIDIFFAQLGELAKRKSIGIIEVLRQNGVDVRESLGRDSVKSQLKVAERLGSKIALILGQKEALDGTIILREMDSGIQETIPQERLVEFLKKKLKK